MVDKNNAFMIKNVSQSTHSQFAGYAKTHNLEQGEALQKLLDLAAKKGK